MTEPNPPPIPDRPKLLEQVRARIRAKHYSIRTETQYMQYMHWVRSNSHYGRITLFPVWPEPARSSPA